VFSGSSDVGPADRGAKARCSEPPGHHIGFHVFKGECRLQLRVPPHKGKRRGIRTETPGIILINVTPNMKAVSDLPLESALREDSSLSVLARSDIDLQILPPLVRGW